MFVAPGGLDIRDGDVLTSAQAGGVMHKVNMTTNIGKGFLSGSFKVIFNVGERSENTI